MKHIMLFVLMFFVGVLGVHASPGSRATGNITVDTRGTATPSTLVVTVRDQDNQAPIAGASVIVDNITRTTDSNGQCTIQPVVHNSAMTIWKTGYGTNTTTTVVPGAGSYLQTVYLRPVIQAQLPVIRSVTVLPSSALLAPALNNPIEVTIHVDWNNTSNRRLRIQTPRFSEEISTQQNTYRWSLTPYDVFNLSSGNQTISVQAISSAGSSGWASRSVDCRVIPSWMTALGLSRHHSGSEIREGYRWRFDSEVLPTLGIKPGKIDLEIIEIGVSLGARGDLFLGTQGDFDMQGSVKGGVEVAAKAGLPGGITPYGKIAAKGTLGMAGNWYPDYSLRSGSVSLNVSGTAGVGVPFRAILLLDPTGAGQSLNAWIDSMPDRLTDFIDDMAYIDFWLSKLIEGNVSYSVQSGQVQIGQTEIGGGVEAGILGFAGFKGVIWAEAALSGRGTVWVAFSSDGVEFDRIEVLLRGHAEAGIGFSVRRSEFDWPMQWPKPTGASAFAMETFDQGNSISSTHGLMSRDYIMRDYALFSGQETRRVVKTKREGIISPLGLVTEQSFIQNVFPATAAAITGSSKSNLWVVYIHDDPSLPQIQGTEIAYSRYINGSWSPPSFITTNTQAEFFPDIAIDASNRPVAAWGRVRDPDYTNTADVAEFMNLLDVVVASYDTDSLEWSTPVEISENNLFNGPPIFAQAPDKSLAVWWQTYPFNQLYGTEAEPESAPAEIWWAKWDPETRLMTSVEPIVTNTVAASTPALVYNGTNAWLFWIEDGDADSSSLGETILTYVKWDGLSWSDPQPLTETNVLVSNSRAVMLNTGEPMVVWWQDGNIVYDIGPNFSGPDIVSTNNDSLRVQDYSLVSNPEDGNVTLVFPNTQPSSINLAYRVYDRGADMWGNDFTFEASNTMDFAISPFYAGNDLIAVYPRRILGHSNEVVTIEGADITISVPYRERTDLMLARFELDYDLQALSITNAPTYPPVLLVDVLNSGDILITNFVTDIRIGSLSGPLVASVTNEVPLPPQTRVTLDVPWAGLPNAQSAVVYAIVDPENEIEEFNESNNVISNRLLKTDLVINGVGYGSRTETSSEWIVSLLNPLARPIADVTLELRRDSDTGPLLGTTNIPHMAAYEELEFVFSMDTDGMANGTPLITKASASEQPGDDTAATTFLRTAFSSLVRAEAPDITGLRFLRSGLNNTIRVAWDPIAHGADGAHIMRQNDMNDPELIGFAAAGEILFWDIPDATSTNVGYYLRAYNADGLGEPTPIIFTNVYLDISGDGLPDEWQTYYFGSPTNDLAGYYDDWDGNGIPNWMEYLFGTDPTDPDDYPRVNASLGENGYMQIEWRGTHLQPYDIEYSPDLIEWNTLRHSFIGMQGTNLWVDHDVDAGDSLRFYRIRAHP